MYPRTDKRTREDVLKEIECNAERRRGNAKRDQRNADILEAVLYVVTCVIYLKLIAYFIK